MKIKIGFTREIKPDLVSKGIMFYLGTDYSHVFFILGEWSYHSTGEGVHKVLLSEYLKTHILVKEFEIDTAHDENAFLAYMSGAEGKDYGQMQYLGFIFPSLQRFVKNGPAKTICSELTSVYLRDYCGKKLLKDPDFMSPKDVFCLLWENE